MTTTPPTDPIQELLDEIAGDVAAAREANAANTQAISGLLRLAETTATRVNHIQNGTIPELQRQARGITRANARAARLETRVGTLEGDLRRLLERADRIGVENLSNAQVQALMAEIERVSDRADTLWTDIQGEITDLRGRVDTHDTRLDNHEDRITMNTDGIEAVRTTVRRIEERSQTPLGVWLIAAIGGVIAGIWWNSIDFVDQLTVGEQSTSLVYKFAEHGATAWGFGFAVFLAIWALLGYLVSIATVEENENQNQQAEGNQPNADEDADDNQDATRVMPRPNPGGGNGGQQRPGVFATARQAYRDERQRQRDERQNEGANA